MEDLSRDLLEFSLEISLNQLPSKVTADKD